MHYERHIMGSDDSTYEMLDAILDGPFAICAIITDAEGQAQDYRFLRVSRCFEDMTSFQGTEGRTIRELRPEIDASWVELYGRVALQRMPAHFTETSESTGRRYEVRAAPLDPPGRFVMAFQDVTELRRLEEERSHALEHAQHLLKELGHRVMNSFAAISAILSMEARATPREHRAALERVQGRVQALAALYRRLDGTSQVDRIEMADYLGGLVASFRDSLAAPVAVAITADLAPMTLPTKAAVPLALIVNELLTNAIKHAFRDGRSGTVHVSLAIDDGLGRLCVADDGAGMPEGDAESGTGRVLMGAFVSELGGEITTGSDAQGTRVTVEFRP